MDLSTILSAKNRLWIYGVAGAAIALLVIYDRVAADAAPLWLALVGAVLWALGNILAITHTDSAIRAALYGVALAVLALLVYYKVVSDAEAAGWGALAATAFGVGTQVLAGVNLTPDEVKDDVVDDFDPHSTDYPTSEPGGYVDDDGMGG